MGQSYFPPYKQKQNYFKWNHSNESIQLYGRKYKTSNYRTHESQPDFYKAPISLQLPTENLAVFFSDLETVNVLVIVKRFLMISKVFITQYRKFSMNKEVNSL